MSLVRESITAGVAEHVRMSLKSQVGLVARALDHAREPGRGERRATL